MVAMVVEHVFRAEHLWSAALCAKAEAAGLPQGTARKDLCFC